MTRITLVELTSESLQRFDTTRLKVDVHSYTKALEKASHKLQPQSCYIYRPPSPEQLRLATCAIASVLSNGFTASFAIEHETLDRLTRL